MAITSGQQQGNGRQQAELDLLALGMMFLEAFGPGQTQVDVSALGILGSDLAHNPNLNSPKSVRFRPGISKPVNVSNWAHGPRHLSWRTSFAVMIVCVKPTVPAWSQRDRARCAAPSVRASRDRNEAHPSEAQANHRTAPHSRRPTSPPPPSQP